MFDVKDDALNRAVNHATQSQLLYNIYVCVPKSSLDVPFRIVLYYSTLCDYATFFSFLKL